ncbi:hypothetical protein EJ05DRAFT_439142 [Pseudovirgaria hyperparasitica]|uniref:GH16 domain-containing protein n=1 Tax=Pseudovirgaria hyperparasitica TaxID=470096 RepID=A0A6A6W6W5_9PEZI|nr:uncharacterized protein EJ05DRAFT_439142 [Pseudovirgaria hyperparasitica]KAF2758285.1 hypothetical protein EJ05DRAFT_439142 [Pseudovirgaria hyperparasitica]
MHSLASTLTWALISSVYFQHCAAIYTLVDDYAGTNFFSGFDFFSDKDPTDGFVQYQPEPDAISKGLVGYLKDDLVPGGQANISSVLVGVDYTAKVTDKGRPSVRLEGKKGYDTGLLVADILHMPDSIDGSWPALWLLGMDAEWPTDGEIDLVEGVNSAVNNAVTLHTTPGCSISTDNGGGKAFSGTVVTDNCDVNAEGQGKNVGCSIYMANSTGPSDPLANYGTAFNANGGGIYVLEWGTSGISAWFFSRSQASTFPPSLLGQTPDPTEFGTPVALFKGECDYASHFRKLRIIINTTFCGAWAGQVWNEQGCADRTKAATCEEYVQNNPDAFQEAYWEFRGLRVFGDGTDTETRRADGRFRRDVVRREERARMTPRHIARPGQKRAVKLRV